MMLVGIIGLGVTGSALKSYLLDTNDNLEIRCRDPKLGLEDDLSDCEYTFICVPTPVSESGQDLSYIYDAIEHSDKRSKIIIRSTVLPGTCLGITKTHNRDIIHMPEFLTERRAHQDMYDQDIMILGCDTLLYTRDLAQIFKHKEIKFMSTMEAELIKYAHNCFGAMKVTYWNAVYDFCNNFSLDYEKVLDGCLTVTPFINKEHTQVPGPDGSFGYGGKCFPDNVKSFVNFYGEEFLGGILSVVDSANSNFRDMDLKDPWEV